MEGLNSEQYPFGKINQLKGQQILVQLTILNEDRQNILVKVKFLQSFNFIHLLKLKDYKAEGNNKVHLYYQFVPSNIEDCIKYSSEKQIKWYKVCLKQLATMFSIRFIKTSFSIKNVGIREKEVKYFLGIDFEIDCRMNIQKQLQQYLFQIDQMFLPYQINQPNFHKPLFQYDKPNNHLSVQKKKQYKNYTHFKGKNGNLKKIKCYPVKIQPIVQSQEEQDVLNKQNNKQSRKDKLYKILSQLKTKVKKQSKVAGLNVKFTQERLQQKQPQLISRQTKAKAMKINQFISQRQIKVGKDENGRKKWLSKTAIVISNQTGQYKDLNIRKTRKILTMPHQQFQQNQQIRKKVLNAISNSIKLLQKFREIKQKQQSCI